MSRTAKHLRSQALGWAAAVAAIVEKESATGSLCAFAASSLLLRCALLHIAPHRAYCLCSFLRALASALASILVGPGIDLRRPWQADPHVIATPIPALAAAHPNAERGAGAAGPITPGGGGAAGRRGSDGTAAVTLTGLGCAVRWLLMGPGPVADALASAADASRFGGPGRRRPRGGGGEGEEGVAEAEAGACAVLGAAQDLVAALFLRGGGGGGELGAAEAACMMAVNAGTMDEAMAAMMFSPGMDDDDGGGVGHGAPVPAVRMALQVTSTKLPKLLALPPVCFFF